MKLKVVVLVGFLLSVVVLWFCFRADRFGGQSGKAGDNGARAPEDGGKKSQDEGESKFVVPWGNEVAGFRMALMFPKAVYSFVEPIPCRFIIRQFGKQARPRGSVETRVSLRYMSVTPDEGQNMDLKMNWNGHFPRYLDMKEPGDACGFRIADVTNFYDLSLVGTYCFRICAMVEEVPAEAGKEGLCHRVDAKPAYIEIRDFVDYPLVERPTVIPAGEIAKYADWSKYKWVDGVALVVAFGKERFGETEPVSCEIILANLGGTARLLPYGRSIAPGFEWELAEVYPAEVYAGERITAEPIALGRTVLALNAKGKDQVRTKVFDPNEGYRLRICALNRFFDMTRPRTFELRVTAVVPGLGSGQPVRVVSNTAHTKVEWVPIVRSLEVEEIEELLSGQESPK